MRSQPVEGGRHRLSTELQESLTEDDAGADQSDAANDNGHHHGQDQGRRQLALRDGSRCSYSSDARYIVAGKEFVIVAEAEDEVGFFISFAALRPTVAAVHLHLDLTLTVTLHGC